MDPEGAPDPVVGRPAVKSFGGVVMSGTLWLAGGQGGRTVATILTLAILARLITPAEFGVVAAAGLIDTVVLAIMNYWFGIALLRSKTLSKAEIQSQVWASLLFSACLAGATIAIAPWVERLLDFPGLAVVMVAFTPLYFAHAYTSASTAMLQRELRFRAAGMAPFICRLVGYSLPAIVMALMGMGLWAIVWAQLASLLLTAVVMIRMSRLPLGWPARLEFGKIGWEGAGGGLYGFIASLQANVDTLAVAQALGPAVTGLYGRAYNISVQAKAPFVFLQLTVRQALAAIQEEPERAQDGLIRVLRLTSIASFIIAAFATVTAEPLTGVLLGPRWLAAAPMLAVLFVGFPARALLLMLDAANMTLGEVWPMVLSQVALLAVIAVGAFAAAPHGGVWVAGVVTAAFWLGVVISTAVVVTRAGISAIRIAAALPPGLALGLVLAALLKGALWLTPDNAFLETGVSGAMSALFCAVVGLFLPDRWLGAYLADARRRALGRLRLR